jgi:hypothetical protein
MVIYPLPFHSEYAFGQFLRANCLSCVQHAITDYRILHSLLLAAITARADFLSRAFKNRITHGNRRHPNPPSTTPQSKLVRRFHLRFCHFAGSKAIDLARPILVFQLDEPD